MPFPFANQKRDAGVETPVLPTTGGTATGSVGAAVPLPWRIAFASCVLFVAGSAGDIRRSAYFPESMTTGVTEDFDPPGRAVRTAVGTSFKWRPEPASVAAVSSTNPNPAPSA